VTRYEITFARSARRELEALDARLVARLWAKVLGLSDDPRPPGCRKLRGEERLWQIRVGEYRVPYSTGSRISLAVREGPRKILEAEGTR